MPTICSPVLPERFCVYEPSACEVGPTRLVVGSAQSMSRGESRLQIRAKNGFMGVSLCWMVVIRIKGGLHDEALRHGGDVVGPGGFMVCLAAEDDGGADAVGAVPLREEQPHEALGVAD